MPESECLTPHVQVLKQPDSKHNHSHMKTKEVLQNMGNKNIFFWIHFTAKPATHLPASRSPSLFPTRSYLSALLPAHSSPSPYRFLAAQFPFPVSAHMSRSAPLHACTSPRLLRSINLRSPLLFLPTHRHTFSQPVLPFLPSSSFPPFTSTLCCPDLLPFVPQPQCLLLPAPFTAPFRLLPQVIITPASHSAS